MPLSNWLTALNRCAQWSLLLGALAWLVITNEAPESVATRVGGHLELTFVMLCVGMPGTLYLARWLKPKDYPRYLRIVLIGAAVLTGVALGLRMPLAVAAGLACPIAIGISTLGRWMFVRIRARRR